MMPITTTNSIRVKPRRDGMIVLGAHRGKAAGNTILRMVIPAGNAQVKGWDGKILGLSAARAARQGRTVEVDVSPAAVAALPDACLLEGDGEGPALGVE